MTTTINDKGKKFPDTKNHDFATDGFTYRTVYFEDSNTGYYKITLSIGHNGNVATIYNVGQIKKDSMPNGNVISMIGSKADMLSTDSIPEFKKSVKISSKTLSELKEKREGLVAEYRELRTQIDAIKESDEYKAFDNEVRTVRKNGLRFGGFAAVKEIRNRQKQWAEAAGLSALEERYDDISGQIHDYDLEIYIPDVAAMETQMKKYEKFFKTADGKQKALEKKNADLSAALEESEKESTVKKLQELRLKSDYERIKGILDRIPPEIIKEYTHRSTQKHDINR